MFRWLKSLLQSPEGKLWTTPTPERWSVANEHCQVWGPDLASAATIAPTYKFHRVTGNTTIDTITPPWATFAGEIYLLATGTWNFSNAGNVNAALASAMTIGQFVVVVYNPIQGKWYPQRHVA